MVVPFEEKHELSWHKTEVHWQIDYCKKEL